MMHTLDGYTITTIEQDGDYAGEDIGRLLILLPGRNKYVVYAGFDTTAERDTVAEQATTMAWADFDEWFMESER